MENGPPGDREGRRSDKKRKPAGNSADQPNEPRANGGLFSGLNNDEKTLASKAATVAVVGLGVALIEAELIPGMLLGVAAMLAPSLLPKVGGSLRPLVKGAVRAGLGMMERARETAAEASEEFQDIVAEVRSEQHAEHLAQTVTRTRPAKAH